MTIKEFFSQFPTINSLEGLKAVQDFFEREKTLQFPVHAFRASLLQHIKKVKVQFAALELINKLQLQHRLIEDKRFQFLEKTRREGKDKFKRASHKLKEIVPIQEEENKSIIPELVKIKKEESKIRKTKPVAAWIFTENAEDILHRK